MHIQQFGRRCGAAKKKTRVWDKETDQLKALVEEVRKGLPTYVDFKLPPNTYRGDPTDAVVQERIKAFLKSKGLHFLSEGVENLQEIDAFRKKVANICAPTPI